MQIKVNNESGILTPREVEVMELVPKSNKVIADKLDIKTRTAGHHIANMERKFGVTSKAELIAVAVARGILTITMMLVLLVNTDDVRRPRIKTRVCLVKEAV